jgi:hypothetical protein
MKNNINDYIVKYSKGLLSKEYIIKNNGEMFFDLLNLYLNDKNSSTLRQLITCESVGITSNPKKLGYDGLNTFEEVKPKNIDFISNNKLDGSGNYTDLTHARHDKYIKDNVIIHVSGFIDGHLIYIVKVPYIVISDYLKTKLNKILPDGDVSNRYLRSARFSFNNYKNNPLVEVEFVRDNIDVYSNKINTNVFNFLKNSLKK